MTAGAVGTDSTGREVNIGVVGGNGFPGRHNLGIKLLKSIQGGLLSGAFDDFHALVNTDIVNICSAGLVFGSMTDNHMCQLRGFPISEGNCLFHQGAVTVNIIGMQIHVYIDGNNIPAIFCLV